MEGKTTRPVERKLAGVIEDFEDKGKYLRVKISGTWYSCWEKTDIPLKVGDVYAYNTYTTESKDKTYINCLDMLFVPQQPAQPAATQQQLPSGTEKAMADMDARERRMVRQTSINAAATFLAGTSCQEIKELLRCAEEIEKHINR